MSNARLLADHAAWRARCHNDHLSKAAQSQIFPNDFNFARCMGQLETAMISYLHHGSDLCAVSCIIDDALPAGYEAISKRVQEAAERFKRELDGGEHATLIAQHQIWECTMRLHEVMMTPSEEEVGQAEREEVIGHAEGDEREAMTMPDFLGSVPSQGAQNLLPTEAKRLATSSLEHSLPRIPAFSPPSSSAILPHVEQLANAAIDAKVGNPADMRKAQEVLRKDPETMHTQEAKD